MPFILSSFHWKVRAIPISHPLTCWFSVLILSLSLVTATRAQVVITEFLASNQDSIRDSNGNGSDWIELVNTAATTVDVSGLALKDNDDTHALTLPAATSIAERIHRQRNGPKMCRAWEQMEQVTIAYGMTETSPVSFQTHVDDPLERRIGTVGRIHPHVEVKIVDSEGRVVPRGLAKNLCAV